MKAKYAAHYNSHSVSASSGTYRLRATLILRPDINKICRRMTVSRIHLKETPGKDVSGGPASGYSEYSCRAF